MYVDLWKWIATIKLFDTTSSLATLLVKCSRSAWGRRSCLWSARLVPGSHTKTALFYFPKDPISTLRYAPKIRAGRDAARTRLADGQRGWITGGLLLVPRLLRTIPSACQGLVRAISAAELGDQGRARRTRARAYRERYTPFPEL